MAQRREPPSDADVELIRDLYEAGLELPEAERRRRQLGYAGLGKRFGLHKSTIRWYVTFRRRLRIGCTGN